MEEEGTGPALQTVARGLVPGRYVEYQNDRGINIVTRLLYCVELCQKNEGTENSVVGSLDPLNYMNVGMTRTESLPLQVQYPTYPPSCTRPNK